ncbi:MAG: hypothetical protein RJA22_2996 [Verrucomicrobiota bacterium]|jgi:hypothetical protein
MHRAFRLLLAVDVLALLLPTRGWGPRWELVVAGTLLILTGLGWWWRENEEPES